MLIFQRLVMGIAGGRGGRAGVAHIEQVTVEDAAEVHVVTDHTDDGGGVVVERCKHVLGLVGPGRGKLLDGDVVEGRVVHGQFGGLGHLVVVNQLRHFGQRCGIGRYAGKPIVDALSLIPAVCRCCGGYRHGKCDQYDPPVAFHGLGPCCSL